jgi:hypothetical protein
MISEAEISEATAHTVLNYCLTMATRNKSNFKFKVQIPYHILAASSGVSEVESYSHVGTALELDVSMTWVENDSENVVITEEQGAENE